LIGRVRQQFFAYVAVSILYAIWAGLSVPSVHISTGGLMAIFTICQFVLNVGPTSTTFLIPAEVYPTRVRGTAHGISAAAGKCGAVITAFAFGTVEERVGMSGILAIFSGAMALAAAVTLVIPETKDRSLNEIEEEALYRQSDHDGSLSPVSSTGDTPKTLSSSKDIGATSSIRSCTV
jgi:MFS transporter, PHS family, inorganic phosphate transporter